MSLALALPLLQSKATSFRFKSRFSAHHLPVCTECRTLDTKNKPSIANGARSWKRPTQCVVRREGVRVVHLSYPPTSARHTFSTLKPQTRMSGIQLHVRPQVRFFHRISHATERITSLSPHAKCPPSTCCCRMYGPWMLGFTRL